MRNMNTHRQPDGSLRSAERRLWSALWMFRQPRHKRAEITVGTLAALAGCSRVYAHICLRRWRDAGAISVRRTGRASIYVIHRTPPWLF